jgi:PAS domain S-box-containing protein
MDDSEYMSLLHTTLSKAPVAIYLKDLNNTYRVCNDKMAEIAGLASSHDIIGKTDADLPWAEKMAGLKKCYKKVLKTKEICTLNVKALPIANGNTHAIHIVMAPTYNHANEIIGVTGVFVDIINYEFYRQDALDKNKDKYTQQAAEIMSESMAKTIFKITGQVIGKEKSVEEQIMAIRNYYESIIACMPNNVYWLDRNCITLGCNDNVARLIKLKSRDDFPGITYGQMGKLAGWTEGQAESFTKDDMEVMSSDKPKLNAEEPPLYDEKGEPVYYISSRVPLHNVDGKVVGVVGISVDITKIKKQEIELKMAKEQAEVANDTKNQFIANMEHDLRTPCSGISEMTKILEQQETDPKKKEVLGDVHKASSQLLEILNSVLTFDHIESKMLPVLHKKFSIRKMLNGIIAMETPYTKHKELELIANCTERVPELLLGDEHRISRILVNLVSNAVKFTTKGYVKINVDLAKQLDEKHVILKLEVKDTGIGIPKDKQNIIYERFIRAYDSNKGIYKGSGLGLSIVKQFISDLKGEIEVISDIGSGTTFECLIPCELPLLSVESGTTPPFTQEKADVIDKPVLANKNLNILLVEDDILAQRVAANVFEQNISGNFDIVSTAKEALDYSTKNKYDLIFMDIGLPDMSGYDVVKKIRKTRNGNNKNTIIVALTAHDSKLAQNSSAKAGMNDFITKPLNENKINTIINTWFISKHKEAKAHKKLKKSKKKKIFSSKNLLEIKGDVIDLSMGMTKINCDANKAKKMINMLIKGFKEDLPQFTEAKNNNDWDTIKALVHKHHGGSLYCGVPRFQEACARLEGYLIQKKTKLREKLYKQFLDEIDKICKEKQNL